MNWIIIFYVCAIIWLAISGCNAVFSVNHDIDETPTIVLMEWTPFYHLYFFFKYVVKSFYKSFIPIKDAKEEIEKKIKKGKCL